MFFLADGSTQITLDSFLQSILHWLTTTGVKLVFAVIALIISFKVVNFFAKRVDNILIRKKVDLTIRKVVRHVIRKGLKILFFLVFLGYIGIETGSIAAAIASLGVGIGLALQGSLSNLAGGIIIIVMRPFKIGDYLETGSFSGTVEDIKIFYTYLATPDNKVVMIPNGSLANSPMVNYSTKELRRVDITFSTSYNEDFRRVEKLIANICDLNELILKEPKPFIRVSAHSASSIDIICKAWVKNEDYWTVKHYLLEEVKLQFDANNIEIPYPQMDVHVNK